MNLVLKKLAALTSATALLSAGLVGITSSAASAASAPLTVTFEDDDTSGYFYGNGMELGADFGGVVSSRETSLPGGRSGAGLKIEIAGETWSGTTILKTTTAAQADGTLFSDTARYAEIDVYSTVAGDMMFKLEGGCANEIRVAHTGSGWETLKFEDLSVTGCTIGSFFALNGVADRNGKVVYLDNLSLPGFTTQDVVVPVTSPSTLVDFSSANARTDFGGSASSIAPAPAGASAGDAMKVVIAGDCYAGTTIADQATSVTLLSAGNTSVTANVFVPAPGARVRLKLEYSLDNAILVETDAIAPVSGWNRLTWDLSGYDATKVYNRVSIFPGFHCDQPGTRVVGDYYVDDIAFNGAVTPKLAPSAKITSPSKKVIAVTVANARGKQVTVTIHGVRTYKVTMPSSAARTFKFAVANSGKQKVTVSVGTTKVSKFQVVK